MAQYNVTAPDGTKYQVTAPDDATQEQVMAYVQQQHAPQSSAPANAQAPLQLSVNPDGATSLSQQTVATQHDALGTAQDFGNALSHHVMNLPIGLAQLVEHGIGLGASALPQDSSIRQYIDRNIAADDASIAKRESDYQKSTPTNANSFAGAAIGEIAPWMVGIGEARAAGLLPEATTWLGKGGALAAEGGLMGALSPVTNGQDFGTQKAEQIGAGAVTAPLAAATGKGLAVGARAVRDASMLATEKGQSALANQKLANILGQIGNKDQVAAQLYLAPRGENVSIAQALKTPEAVQAERALRNDPNAGPALVQAQNANNAQRLATLRQLAGTPEQMDAAINARREMANEFTNNNLAYLPPAQRWQQAETAFQNILDKPSRMPSSETDAIREARAITRKVQNGSMHEDDAVEALNELRGGISTKKGNAAFDAAQQSIDARMIDPRPILDQIALSRNTGLGQNSTVKGAMGEIAQAIQKAQDSRGLVPADVLDGIRQNMRKILANNHNQNSPLSTQEEAGVGPLKDAIAQALDRRIPGYSDYLAAYRSQSVPINTMERVGTLLDPNRAGGVNASGDQALTGPAIKAFLRQHADELSPEARSKLEAMRNSLERERISEAKISAAGSDTDANLKLPRLSRSYSGNLGRALGIILGGSSGYGAGLPGGELVGAGVGSVLGDKLAGFATRANANVARMVGERAANAQSAAAALQQSQRKAAKVLTPVQRALLNRLLPYQAPR